MTTGVSEPLTREQQVQSLEAYVPKELLTSLGGVDNVLKSIPQNNKFSHPEDDNLANRLMYSRFMKYEQIDAQHNTEINISKDFVIFVVRRQIERYPNPQGFEGVPISLIAFSMMGNHIHGPYYPVDHQNKFWPTLSKQQAIRLVEEEVASITETPKSKDEILALFESASNISGLCWD